MLKKIRFIFSIILMSIMLSNVILAAEENSDMREPVKMAIDDYVKYGTAFINNISSLNEFNDDDISNTETGHVLAAMEYIIGPILGHQPGENENNNTIAESSGIRLGFKQAIQDLYNWAKAYGNNSASVTQAQFDTIMATIKTYQTTLTDAERAYYITACQYGVYPAMNSDSAPTLEEYMNSLSALGVRNEIQTETIYADGNGTLMKASKLLLDSYTLNASESQYYQEQLQAAGF